MVAEMESDVGNSSCHCLFEYSFHNMTVTEAKPPATTGTGLPTYQELLDHYPARFTWQQLKAFVNSGFVLRTCFRYLLLTDDSSDLGLLKRDKMLQLRYNDWTKETKKKWGTMGLYLPARPHLPPAHSRVQTYPRRELSVEISPSVGSTR